MMPTRWRHSVGSLVHIKGIVAAVLKNLCDIFLISLWMTFNNVILGNEAENRWCDVCMTQHQVLILNYVNLLHAGPHCSQTEALRHLVALYVGRTHASWKEPEVLTWLERNVKEVLQRVDDMDPLPNEYTERLVTSSDMDPLPNEYAERLVMSSDMDPLPNEYAERLVMSSDMDPLPNEYAERLVKSSDMDPLPNEYTERLVMSSDMDPLPNEYAERLVMSSYMRARNSVVL